MSFDEFESPDLGFRFSSGGVTNEFGASVQSCGIYNSSVTAPPTNNIVTALLLVMKFSQCVLIVYPVS